MVGEHGLLTDFVHEGMTDDQVEMMGSLPAGRGLLGAVTRSDGPIVIHDIASHPQSIGFPENHPPMTTFLGVPVSLPGEQFGNLYLTDKPNGFTDQDVSLVETLSRIAGAAIQTARLQTRLRSVAVVEDRQRIARDLHDSVIQDLFAVGLNLQGAGALTQDERVSNAIYSAVDSLDSSVNALRSYIFELKDTDQPAVDLDEKLQVLVARMGSVYPARVSLSLDPDVSGPWDDDIVMLTTEALSNALRHSNASNVEVEVLHQDHAVWMSVIDDGVGFSNQDRGTGMGLSNMRIRAARLGGSVRIDSRPGEGTRIEVTIPTATPDS